MAFKIISAGAGSGKTYRLTEEMLHLLQADVRANGIIATTFTKKAAGELQERVRVKLLEEGLTQTADDLTNALIGTVHGMGVKLLKRFAYEAGVSPQVDIIADEDQQILFNQSLANVLLPERIHKLEEYSNKLGLNKKGPNDWRKEVKALTDIARANDFSIEVLEKSKKLSFDSFNKFLDKASNNNSDWFNRRLSTELQSTIQLIDRNEDSTSKTKKVISTLKDIQNQLRLKGELEWHQWVKISKLDVGAKSKGDIVDLKEFAETHLSHTDFHQDIEGFISSIFDIAIAALNEYDDYKKQRGLIDYIDMEIHVKRLLDHPIVQEVLKEELDLLMVDEFQDTNPIQLAIFLKLATFAKYAIWVGDPKQSIYGFRGADPKLMEAIVQKNGGIKKEDIQEYSWRSREDIVFATNALFCKAFSNIPNEQVALKPKRTKKATAESATTKDEPLEIEDALMHWHFQYDGDDKRFKGNKLWMDKCIATTIKTFLDKELIILPKGEKEYRPIFPGDVAVLCRSNKDCQEIAKALHHVGLKAAISRAGLLKTAESRLILACLKYILNRRDALSAAEILKLAGHKNMAEIIEERMTVLSDTNEYHREWGQSTVNPYILKLDDLRNQVIELSGSEILNLVIDELDLRRIITAWGNSNQRMDNIDVLRKFALQYEDACHRLHSAASLGGFLLWLNDLENKETDNQGSGEGKDAVNVLTYHKSKGLEWPFVVCGGLESKSRNQLWGMRLVAEKEEVDLNDLLGNRWICYWVNPYADQIKNTTLEDRINQSEAKAAVKEKVLEEDARLLYVGITRARDYLVFPSRNSAATSWLNRIWHDGNEDYPTLDPNSYETPWIWNDKCLTITTEIFPFPKDFPRADDFVQSLSFMEERNGKKDHIPYLIDFSKENFNGFIKAKTAITTQFSAALSINEESQNHYTVAKALKAFLSGDRHTYEATQRLEMAENIVERFGLGEELNPQALVNTSSNYFDFLKKRWSIRKTYRKFPIRGYHKERLFENVIDLVLETDNRRLILIQNSSFSGDTTQWRNKALELGAWFYFAKKAVQTIFKTDAVETHVHFVLQGSLVEINSQEVASNQHSFIQA